MNLFVTCAGKAGPTGCVLVGWCIVDLPRRFGGLVVGETSPILIQMKLEACNLEDVRNTLPLKRD